MKIDKNNYQMMPYYIELYNDSDKAINPAEYVLAISDGTRASVFSYSLAKNPLPAPVKLIAPGAFLAIDLNHVVSNEEYDLDITSPSQIINTPVNLDSTSATLSVPGQLQLLRGGSGVYAKDIKMKPLAQTVSDPTSIATRFVFRTVTADEQIAETAVFYDSPLYTPRTAFPLAPIEILANPKSCADPEDGADCMEYVKFYNSTSDTVVFDGIRLRVGLPTQASTASNTTQLTGSILPGQYVYFPIGITNSGGSIWLEDRYGAAPIDGTLVTYPDASSTSKKGKSWAQFEDRWDWAIPSPGGANTPLPVDVPGKGSVNTLIPCREDQYRNPLTNRCKLIATSSTSALKPCAANQYRSPETNRCRNSATSSSASALKPCAPNQYRSLETNRCRLLASTASSLTPCKTGQERNPATNRCRNVMGGAMPKADFPIEKMKQQANDTIGWLAFAGVGSMAVGYGAWEWRRELSGVIGRIAGMIKR
ncbi:MAG TPA: hypothetical protein VGE13_00740 [Candidatus Saccharimonadales bacterium]